MALLTPRVLKRGLQFFGLVSVIGVAALLFYTGAWETTLAAVTRVRPGWALLALALASLDWLGGGLRIWILTRHVWPRTPFWGMVAAGGLNTWASYLTPSQTGGGPVMIYAMRRAGVPFPEAAVASLMSFVATVAFFAAVGPAAILLGAGRSLRAHSIPVLNFSFYDIFRASAGVFVAVGTILLVILILPGSVKRLLKGVVGWLGRTRGDVWAARVEGMSAGIDRMHASVVKYFRTPAGWLAMAGGIVTTALAHANKLCAGYVVMRALGLETNVFDVLMIQTTITFLLYFAPTPGGSGAAETLSAALMSVYVPNALLPAYTILWRFTVSYATVIFGSYVFYKLLHGRLDEADAGGSAPATA